MIKRILSLGTVGLALVAAAMPTKKELKDVQGLVNELMADDLAAKRAGKMTASEVAAKAETYANDAQGEAAKFLFLKGAFGLYMQDENYAEALRALNALTANVKDVPDKVMAEIVLAKLKKVSKKKGTPVFDYYERLELRLKMAEERAKLEKAVKENPKSRECRRDLAVCLAVMGDWPAALNEFQQSGGKEAEAAEAEKAGNAAVAADLWWAAAQGDAEDAIRTHAATLYRQAIADGKITGLKLTLAKKRVADALPASNGEAGTPPQRGRDVPVASEEKEVASAPRRGGSPAAPEKAEPASGKTAATVVPFSHGKYDWSVPENLNPATLRTIEIDLGCPDKMRFFAVPPGEVTKSGIIPFKYKITRPFWISQYPVTLSQYKALGLKCSLPIVDELAKIYKDDPSIAVRPLVNYDESMEFYRKLNAKFGRLLPKGLVFRPITIAEMELNHWNRNWHTRGDIPPNRGNLSALQKKGFYKDATDVHQALKFQGPAGRKPHPFGIQTNFGNMRTLDSFRQVLDISPWEGCVALDTISTPDADDAVLHHATEEAIAVLKANSGPENPFWYCSEKAQNRRFNAGNYPLMVYGRGRSIVLRVVVGYDYVGEWKRQHGK